VKDATERKHEVVTERDKWRRRTKRALRNATHFSVARYLMANTAGRLDGCEKADEHRRLCRMFVSIICDIPYERVTSIQNKYKAVHEHTQQLTAYLDEAIGFPLHDTRPDYEKLEPKFFNRFYDLALEALKVTPTPKEGSE